MSGRGATPRRARDANEIDYRNRTATINSGRNADGNYRLCRIRRGRIFEQLNVRPNRLVVDIFYPTIIFTEDRPKKIIAVQYTNIKGHNKNLITNEKKKINKSNDMFQAPFAFANICSHWNIFP